MRSPDSLQTNHTAIKHKMDQDYTNNLSLWSIYWTQGNIAVRGEAGDESLMAQFGNNVASNGRGSYYFNRIRPICNMISGYQRRNRKSTIAVPLENGDDETADQFTKLLLHIFKRENVYEIISEAFHQGACISGMNLLHLYLDFTRDPVNGDFKVDNLAYNDFMIDPYFRQPDLSDAQFIWRRTYMSHAAAAAIMPPENYDAIMSLQGNPSGFARDGRFTYQAEAFGYTQSNKVSYDEYYYRDYRKQKLLVDRDTGETLDITLDMKHDIDQFIKDHPQVFVEEKMVPTVNLCIQIQDTVFYNGPQPLGLDCFPFVSVIGFYNKSMPYMYQRIQGVTKSLLDPQFLLNRRIVLNADFMESVVNTGWIFKENALIDVKHLFQTGQGRIIPLKDEAQMTDIMPIQPPQVPPSFFQQLEVYDQEMYNCAGLSQENLGKVIGDDASGYLSALRQGAGLTAQQPIFDRLDLSQNMLGNMMIEAIQKNWTPGKVKRVLEGEQPAPLFYNEAFGKYHCMVELGFNTESQKQMEFAQKMELRKAGIMIPDADVLSSATLQGKDDIIKRMEAQTQLAQQQQQQALQVQLKELESKMEVNHAKALADLGLHYERTSRVQENYALAQERRAAALRDEDEAILAIVKAAKELEGLDLAHLKQIIEMHNSVKQQEMAELAQNQAQSEPHPANQPSPKETPQQLEVPNVNPPSQVG